MSLNIATDGRVLSNNSDLRIVHQTSTDWWGRALGQFVHAQPMNQINRICIHHRGAGVGGAQTHTIANIRNWWPDWHQPGYHFIIQANGEVWQLTHINRQSNGVTNQNTNVIHICINGNFWDGNPARSGNALTHLSSVHLPSAAQQTAAHRLISRLIANSTLSGLTGLSQVRGHRDFDNEAANACPGYTIQNTFRLAQGYPFQTNNNIPGGNAPTINTFVGPATVTVPATGSVGATLSWTTTNATSVEITASNGTAFTGSRPVNGSVTHTFNATASIATGSRTLTLTARNASGSVSRSITMNIQRAGATRPTNFRHLVPRGNFSNVRNGGANGAISAQIPRGNWIRTNDNNNTWVQVQGAQGNPNLGPNPTVLQGNEYNIQVMSNGQSGVVDGGTRTVVVTANGINARRWPVNGPIEATIPQGMTLPVRFRSHADGGAGSGQWAQVQAGTHAGRWVSLLFVRNV